eukprot:scaffold8070_cov117-Cylindrotheca_fusiformis.AAC.9
MPLYDRLAVSQQHSGDTECTDALLKRHQHHPVVVDTHHNNTIGASNSSSSSDDDIFSGRRLNRTGSAYTAHSIKAKPTPATLEESLSGDYQQFGVQHPSVSFDESGTSLDERERQRQQYSQQPMESYEEGDYPPEEQYYQDLYLQQEGNCYADDGQPYYDDEGGTQFADQRDDYYYDDGYSYEEERMHGQEPRQYYEDHSYYDGEEQSYATGRQYSYCDPQGSYYSEYDQGNQELYARENEDGTWEESSEAYETVTSKTLNTNLEGINYLQDQPNNGRYYGEEETTAFDYSISNYPDRAAPPDIAYDGASTLASPVYDDERSQGSNSVWEGHDLRNRSLLDSPLSQNDYTVDHTEYTEETEGTRRPVSKFIKKVTNVRYKDGEFRIQQSSGSRGGSGKSNRRKKKKTESATILDIMFNVGHDLLVGSPEPKGRGRRRRKDPTTKIVDGFKDLFSCNGADDDSDY